MNENSSRICRTSKEFCEQVPTFQRTDADDGVAVVLRIYHVEDGNANLFDHTSAYVRTHFGFIMSESSSTCSDSRDNGPLQISVACETYRVDQFLATAETTSVTSIDIGVPQGERTPAGEIVDRFALIGQKVPSVEAVVISPHRDEDDDFMDPGHLPIRALGEMCCAYSESLEGLSLQHGLLLTGTHDDYEYACRCMSRMAKLKRFQMQACGVFVTNRVSEVESSVTDALFSGLKNVATLEVVDIDRMMVSEGLESFCKSNQDDKRQGISLRLSNTHLSGRQLQALCDPRSRLVKLELFHIAGIRGHVKEMASCLRNNQTLKALTISCPYLLKCSEAMPFFEILEEDTALETLGLNVHCCDNFDYKAPMGDAIQRMRSLKQLRLHLHDPNTTRRLESAGVFLERLGQNKSLTEFCLHLEKFHESYDEILDMYGEKLNGSLAMALEKNSGLTSAILTINGCRKVPFTSNVEFWLRYNRAGRRDIENHPDDRKLWVDKIIEQKHDTEMVFHLLWMNPLLCLPGAINTDKCFQVCTPQRKRKRNSSDKTGRRGDR